VPNREANRKTTVGAVDAEVLAFTAGRDAVLDLALAEADCIGSAAHVTMLSRMRVKPRLFSDQDRRAVIGELVQIMKSARRGRFQITVEDQDVHLAVERLLTAGLGVLGKRIHTGRSRNDQVALDLRLYAKTRLQAAVARAAELARELLLFARRHQKVPMAGRTHMQPAMPSSVGLWASAHAESLLEDIMLMINAYELNDQCPLGAAAGYGVPLPLDRQLVSDLLGFSRPCQNVLYAVTARGKLESIILSALSQAMLTLSRLSEDIVIYSMPEFGYFRLPPAFCTGSSIMPQKFNPDVLELIRARAVRVASDAQAVAAVVRGLGSGYHRDVQETKEPLMNGMDTTESALRIMTRFIPALKVDRAALKKGFVPGVFAADRALALVAGGMPFREAYQHVKDHLDELSAADPDRALAAKISLGAPANIDFAALLERAKQASAWAADEQKSFNKTISRLLGQKYPLSPQR